jgi:hypothetical protein
LPRRWAPAFPVEAALPQRGNALHSRECKSCRHNSQPGPERSRARRRRVRSLRRAGRVPALPEMSASAHLSELLSTKWACPRRGSEGRSRVASGRRPFAKHRATHPDPRPPWADFGTPSGQVCPEPSDGLRAARRAGRVWRWLRFCPGPMLESEKGGLPLTASPEGRPPTCADGAHRHFIPINRRMPSCA